MNHEELLANKKNYIGGSEAASISDIYAALAFALVIGLSDKYTAFWPFLIVSLVAGGLFLWLGCGVRIGR